MDGLTNTSSGNGTYSRWPFRLALAMAVCAVPLVLFGGTVTTLGAGMAVDGWLIAEGHFLVLFPIESWFRDTATFVEHTHRLFGVLVGLFAIATVVATFLCDARGRARALAVLALLAICAQGALGGFRVLENSPNLAFVHGALAQAVFAVLACTAYYLSPRWHALPSDSAAPVRVTRAATFATLAIYAQIVLGAWYRHSLRPVADPASTHRFMAHVVGAVLVIAAVVVLGRALAESGAPGADRKRRMLIHLLGVQVVLGVLALMGYKPGAVGPVEWILSITHILGGGLMLYHAAAVRMWASRGGQAIGIPVGGQTA